MRARWLTRTHNTAVSVFPGNMQHLPRAFPLLSRQFFCMIFSTGSEGIVGIWAGQETTETRSVSPPQLQEREREKNGKGTGNVYLEEAACENMTRGSF